MEAMDEMRDDKMTLLNAREAAQYLRVSLFTLSRIEKEGGLIPFRTPGGHRRYSLRMLHEYLETSRNSWTLRDHDTQLELAQA
jgi:excisionase family DNA binding protein